MYDASDKSTCLPVSVSGPEPCAELGGLTIAEFSQALVPANLSATRATAAGLMMSGIYGRRCSNSPSSAILTSLLVNRLRQRTASLGSTLYDQTWKERTTPSGLSIWRLRALGRRISASDFTGSASPIDGWPTPRTVTGGPESAARKRELGRVKSGGGDLQAVALVAGWPSPTTPSGGQTWPEGTTAEGQTPDGRKIQVTLGLVTEQAGWPTPMAGTPAQNGNSAAGNNDSSRATVALVDPVGWPTPTTQDNTHCYGPDKTINLKTAGAARLANHSDTWPEGSVANWSGWPTPRAEDAESSGARLSRGVADTLTAVARISGPARLTAAGRLLTGSIAGMDAGGQLNPGHSRWLMLCRNPWEQWAPGWLEWQLWQGLISAASPPPNASGPEPSGALETP
jgi:hypothetical protein